MNSFINSLNVTRTDNGALTLKSSSSKVMDFFALGGALRTRSEADVKSMFADAYNEDKNLALKTAFYLRDVRGGQGERKTFRVICDWLTEKHPDEFVTLMSLIAEYGRWDDLIRLVNSNSVIVPASALFLIKEQLIKDIDSENPSLLGKWLPSANCSNKEQIKLAKKISSSLGISAPNYRKMLSKLRAKIKIVEAQMCAKDWSEIDYQRVPSRASMLYRKAFARHDEDGYAAFLAAVEKGEKKINASTLYPYDIVSKFVGYNTSPDATLEAQWKALPDYLEGNEGGKGIVVADVSGSMGGLPIQVSVSLAIYMAERNVGPFKDAWITFSGRPNLEVLKGDTLYERIQNMDTRNWAMNTDVNAVFDLILSRGKMAKVPAEDMPDTVYIITDMMYDACANPSQTNFEYIKESYENSGYKMPQLVFWNVNASQTVSPVSKDEKGTMLVSGCSPSIFKSVMESKAVTPYDLMLEVLNSDRYSVVAI